MITGVVVVSIFVVVIATNFNEANREMQEKLRLFDKVGVTSLQNLDEYYSTLPDLPDTPDTMLQEQGSTDPGGGANDNKRLHPKQRPGLLSASSKVLPDISANQMTKAQTTTRTEPNGDQITTVITNIRISNAASV